MQVKTNLSNAESAKAFRGMPILLTAAGLMAVALHGLAVFA